jgi:phosphoglycolate phosphatase
MHLLFDLDGTLTDPAQGILGCIRHALSRLQIDIDADTPLEPFIGPPLRDTFRTLLGVAGADLALVEAAVAIYRERFTKLGLYENRVYDGIPQSLERLHACADSIHLATSKPRVYAERILEHFGLARYFDGIYGSELDGRLGDKTELIAHLLEREGLDAADSVMIGDRSYDVVGASNNKVDVIGVLWGYGSAAELAQAGARQLCRHPGELADQLARAPGRGA